MKIFFLAFLSARLFVAWRFVRDVLAGGEEWEGIKGMRRKIVGKYIHFDQVEANRLVNLMLQVVDDDLWEKQNTLTEMKAKMMRKIIFPSMCNWTFGQEDGREATKEMSRYLAKWGFLLINLLMVAGQESFFSDQKHHNLSIRSSTGSTRPKIIRPQNLITKSRQNYCMVSKLGLLACLN